MYTKAQITYILKPTLYPPVFLAPTYGLHLSNIVKAYAGDENKNTAQKCAQIKVYI